MLFMAVMLEIIKNALRKAYVKLCDRIVLTCFMLVRVSLNL